MHLQQKRKLLVERNEPLKIQNICDLWKWVTGIFKNRE